MHDNSMNLMLYFRDKYLLKMMGATILDIGSFQYDGMSCYGDLLRDWYKYVGMDIVSGKNVDIVGYESISSTPYYVVISGQTMEHVKRPWDWLKSLTAYYTRYICIIAPSRWREHRNPLDTYRYYPDGMRDLFEYVGIREIEIFRLRTDTIGIGGK